MDNKCMFHVYCFANAINEKYSFIERFEDGSVRLYESYDQSQSKGIELDKTLFNTDIFDSIPINRRCSLKQVLVGYKLGSSKRIMPATSIIHYTYPYNLIKAVFGFNNEEAKQQLWFEITDDRQKGIDYALSSLTNREECLLKLYFEEELTLENIGLIHNLSKERCRQIIIKGIRKLRHPLRSRYLIEGYDVVTNEIRRKEELIKKEADEILKIKEEAARKRKEQINKKEERNKYISIANLDLSFRSYNCLCRAGILTLYDLSNSSCEDLSCIRNLGRCSLNEIISKAKEFGIEIKRSNVHE